ncbi:MAG: hypothetical protein M1817_005317 [Caeruleum heppii]|nr:MAG: hypothetical protein M1817_005317 [Caeruleum heppii]
MAYLTDYDLTELREIRKLTTQLVTERDVLRTELTYTKQAVAELTTQVEYYDDELNNCQMALQIAIHQLAPPLTIGPKPVTPARRWIKDTWLSNSDAGTELAKAEVLWIASEYQRAINSLSLLLKKSDLTSAVRIDAKLLLSSIQRDCDRPCEALIQVEEALNIATRRKEHQLVGKAQFHRALCLFEADKFGDAAWCVGLAAGTDQHANKITELKQKIQDKIDILPTKPQ